MFLQNLITPFIPYHNIYTNSL